MRLPRLVHPVAWWVWAFGLVALVTRTVNPWITAPVICLAVLVSWVRRPVEARSVLPVFLFVGAVGLVIRLLAGVFVGGGSGVTVLGTLPRLEFGGPLTAVGVGGQITVEAVLRAVYFGLQLMAILACVGAANDLAPPHRLLKYVPASLYEVGTAVVVAVSFAPQLAGYARQIRAARRLRGHDGWGVREVSALLAPVLAAAMDRCWQLAASMESRGFGRVSAAGRDRQRGRTTLTFTGLVTMVAGSYGLLGIGVARWVALMLVGCGVLAVAAGLVVGDRSPRTRYRPDPWAAPEWVLCGAGCLTALFGVTGAAAGEASVLTSPASWPQPQGTVLIAIAVAVAAAAFTPTPPLPVQVSSPVPPGEPAATGPAESSAT
ncbi:MAG: cobalt ABC transporter permease [Micrococcales bacterium]|nr:MAG: cobalt ABC transporter permease [Micrococcales bacterium]PIE27936.1 MAG: cobalt ABC transporter permease [Micrococcales bacterium]